MHVLPLPFGMALAVLPRRDAQRLRKPKPAIRFYSSPARREHDINEKRYVDVVQRMI